MKFGTVYILVFLLLFSGKSLCQEPCDLIDSVYVMHRTIVHTGAILQSIRNPREARELWEKTLLPSVRIFLHTLYQQRTNLLLLPDGPLIVKNLLESIEEIYAALICAHHEDEWSAQQIIHFLALHYVYSLFC